MKGAPSAEVRIHTAIADIGREAWDACNAASDYDDNPFTCFDFLQALEESGSVAARTGWAPRHLNVQDAAGGTIGVMPLYLKSHSQGEYVFDHAWADAYDARRRPPTIPSCCPPSPFSPVTGPANAGRGRTWTRIACPCKTSCLAAPAQVCEQTMAPRPCT